MNLTTGYTKTSKDNTSVLLAGGGDKALSEFIGSLTWDSTNKKIQYTPVGGTTTDLVTLSWSNISGKPSTFAPSSHTHAATTFQDTRNSAATPTDAAAYNGLRIDFKTKSVSGITSSGNYTAVVTMDGYADVTGGYPSQLGFSMSDLGEGRRLYFRSPKSSTEWGAWNTLAFTSDIPDVSNLNAKTLDSYPIQTIKYLYHDIAAFCNVTTPTYYISTNGTTFTESTCNKEIFSAKEDYRVDTVTDTIKAVYWLWTTNVQWSQINSFMIGWAFISTHATVNVKFEGYINDAWETLFEKIGETANAQPKTYILTKSVGEHSKVRLTITRTSSSGTAPICGIKLLTSRWGDQGKGSEYEKPYKAEWVNANQANLSIQPWSNNTTYLGTSTNNWAGIYGYYLTAQQTVTTPTLLLNGSGTSYLKTSSANLYVQGNSTGAASKIQNIYIKTDNLLPMSSNVASASNYTTSGDPLSNIGSTSYPWNNIFVKGIVVGAAGSGALSNTTTISRGSNTSNVALTLPKTSGTLALTSQIPSIPSNNALTTSTVAGATQVTVSEGSTDGNYFLTFAASSRDLPKLQSIYTNSRIKYNPSTDTLEIGRVHAHAYTYSNDPEQAALVAYNSYDSGDQPDLIYTSMRPRIGFVYYDNHVDDRYRGQIVMTKDGFYFYKGDSDSERANIYAGDLYSYQDSAYKKVLHEGNTSITDTTITINGVSKSFVKSLPTFTATGGTNIGSVGTPSVSYSNGTFTFNYLKGATGTRGALWYTGTNVNHTTSTATAMATSDSVAHIVGDIWYNASNYNLYKCTTAGTGTSSKWTLVGSIRGATGAASTVQGPQGPQGIKGDTGPQGTLNLIVSTAPTSYTTTTNGFTPRFRILTSTVTSQSGITPRIGDSIIYGGYAYTIGTIYSTYCYLGPASQYKGDPGDGSSGTPVTLPDHIVTSDDSLVQDLIIADFDTSKLVGPTTIIPVQSINDTVTLADGILDALYFSKASNNVSAVGGALYSFTVPSTISIGMGQTVTITVSVTRDSSSVFSMTQITQQLTLHIEGLKQAINLDQISKTINSNVVTFTIANVTQDFEYYVEAFGIQSSTGNVYLTGGVASAPNINLQVYIKPNNKAYCIGYIYGFYPSGVEIRWRVDSVDTTDGVSTTKPHRLPNGMYMVRTILSRTPAQVKGCSSIGIKVTHLGKTKEVSKNQSDIIILQ